MTDFFVCFFNGITRVRTAIAMYEFTPNWTKNGKVRDHRVPLRLRKSYGIIPAMPNKGTFFLNRLNPTSLRSRATSRMYSDLTMEEQIRQRLRLRNMRIS